MNRRKMRRLRGGEVMGLMYPSPYQTMSNN
jgi:hypothetical protein